MSEFISLSNSETEATAQVATPLSNFLVGRSGSQEYMDVVGWIHHHGLKTTDTLRRRVNKLSLLFGVQPNLFKQYEGRTAVWGFRWQKSEHAPHNEFIVYYSNRGISIEVHPKFRKDMLYKLLTEIRETVLRK